MNKFLSAAIIAALAAGTAVAADVPATEMNNDAGTATMEASTGTLGSGTDALGGGVGVSTATSAGHRAVSRNRKRRSGSGKVHKSTTTLSTTEIDPSTSTVPGPMSDASSTFPARTEIRGEVVQVEGNHLQIRRLDTGALQDVDVTGNTSLFDQSHVSIAVGSVTKGQTVILSNGAPTSPDVTAPAQVQ